MDRATSSPHWASNAQPQSPASHNASNCPPQARNTTDLVKVGKNAIASALTLGGCFGTMTALNNAVRSLPGMPMAARIVTGLLPSASVFATPWVEDGARQTLGTTATLPARASLAHDAVASVGLFLFNVACGRSAWVPKFAAATPAGVAASVLQCAGASLVAGGASEFSAQWMNARATVTPPHPTMHNTDKATGRVLSQLPAATLQTELARSGKPLPRGWSLLPVALVTGGWSFRRLLAPPMEPGHPLPTGAWV